MIEPSHSGNSKRKMRGINALPLMALIFTGGCAHYKSDPLVTDPAILAAPDVSILSRDAQAIKRPFLRAQAIDFGQPLDANAVAVLAVIANPDLKALRARLGVSDAQAFAARLLPDPSFSFNFDHLLSGPDNLDNFVGQLGFDIAALRARKSQEAGANAGREQVRLDVAWAEWQTASQARLQAMRLVSLTRNLDLIRANATSTQSLLDRTLRAAGRGDLAADQVQSARIAALDATDRLRSAEKDVSTTRGTLMALLGLAPETLLQFAPLRMSAPILDPARLFTLASAQRFDLKALAQGYKVQEAAVRKAVLDQFPTLNLTLTGTRDTTGNKLVGPGISFTLPLWNRNRGGIAVALATRAQLKAEYEARLFQTRADIAAAVSGIQIAQKQRDALAAQIEALERFASATGRAAKRGDLSLATAETAVQSLRDKQIALASVSQAIAEQIIALELLTGVPQEDWTK